MVSVLSVCLGACVCSNERQENVMWVEVKCQEFGICFCKQLDQQTIYLSHNNRLGLAHMKLYSLMDFFNEKKLGLSKIL